MQMDAMVNQVESEWLRIGQTAQVSFDAFPGLSLPARIHSIGALAVGGWRLNYYVRNIAVSIRLLEQHPQVIPDLSAGADILVQKSDDSLIVPIEAIHEAGGKIVAHVKDGNRFVARPVELGLRNNTHVQILSGLRAGQEVALGDAPPATLTAAVN